MALVPSVMTEVGSILETMSRKIWKLLACSPPDELRLIIPTEWGGGLLLSRHSLLYLDDEWQNNLRLDGPQQSATKFDAFPL
jgi:hypothetical protein